MDSVKVTISADNYEAHAFEGRYLVGSLIEEDSKEGRRCSKLLIVGKASPTEIVQSMAATTAQAIMTLSDGEPEVVTTLLLQFFKDELKKMMEPGGYNIMEHLNFLTKEEMEENNG